MHGGCVSGEVAAGRFGYCRVMAKKQAARVAVTLEQARAFWCAKQGLAPHLDAPLIDIIERTGWVRTLGGVDVYLAVRARYPGLRRAELDAAVARGALRVLPAARGCIYLVPERDRALALGFAASMARPRTERDLDKAGVTWEEVEDLAAAVRAALKAGPMTTSEVRKALPGGSVRSLGAAGKKVGMSSPLPVALRELELDGHIERTLEGGRLDSERYVWRLVPGGGGARRAGDTAGDAAERLRAVAARFFEMAGPASIKELAAWSGATQRDAKAAVERLPVVPVAIAGRDPAWVLERDVDALSEVRLPEPARFGFLPFEDNLVTVHGGPAAHVDPAHHGRPVPAWGGTRRPQTLGEANHVGHRSLLLGDRIAGFWEYDPRAGEVVCRAFDPVPRGLGKALKEQAAGVAGFLRDDVGHGRSFSLDTDDALHTRAQDLRAAR